MEKATVGNEGAVPATGVAPENEEATEAWSGVLFDRFVEFRELIVDSLKLHGDAAIRLHPPKPGDRVLDIGCGFGDATQQLAALIGPEGEAVGVDVAEPFVQASIEEAREAGVRNVEFLTGDVQVMEFPGTFDCAFSRMGVMFFANPVQALRNIRGALRPGGRLVAVVWRRKLDNPWVQRAEEVVEKYLEEPEESDEPTCGPGPFSMQSADTVSEQLQIAGFEQPTFTRCDLPLKLGNDLDHAVRFNMALGPAAEIIRLNGDDANEIRPKLEAEIREVLSDYAGPDGVWAPASTWIISATAPA
ncbi:MAG TPA: methyltransferase domain-containing protein [Solirubrobacterales bacterium]|nr:methyltransferase domain-containing protein [Solirubrobacterales bacterium]